MSIFKRKPKRSEWFEGLLAAEEIYKNGGHLEQDSSYALWFKESSSSNCLVGFRKEKPDYCQGAIDYIEHHHNLEALDYFNPMCY